MPSSSLDSQGLNLAALAMANALHHRGPDDVGVWADSTLGLALAHQRLAVLDLSPAGHQPMLSASGRYVIAFNGEIYNHLDIRRDLERASLLNQPWRGHSDTETLLAAIEAWGLQGALHRCAGMAALALWDRKTRMLHFARDRFGEKPLYWGWLDQAGQRVLVFGSELSALRNCPGASVPALNPEALSEFFRVGYIPAPQCIYAGFQQLPPGHTLQLTGPLQQPLSRPWWDLQQQAAQSFEQQSILALSSDSAALELLQQTLQHVIAEQSLADVPLGTFLSGGVDSSLITALLQASRSSPVRSFTIAFPDEEDDESGFNEAPHAAAVAAYLGTEHTEVSLTATDALALIPQLSQLYSEPFADSSQLPTHLVCREARRNGLKVALSGDGGDELFAGYSRHRIGPQLQMAFGWMPSFFLRGLATAVEHAPVRKSGLSLHKRRKLGAAMRACNSLPELYRALTSLSADSTELLSPLIRSAGSFGGLGLFDLPKAPSAAEQLMLADSMSYLPGDILVKVDRAAMAASLEARAPFLDHRVATLAWQLPLSLKLRDGVGKWPLRQLLSCYVPRALTDRPKAGFAMPIGSWLRGPLKSWAEDLLDPALIRQQGWLQPEPLQKVWQAHLAGEDHTPQLWSVLMWQSWLINWN